MSAPGRRAPTIFDGPPYAAAPVPLPATGAGDTHAIRVRPLVATGVRALCTLAAVVLVASALVQVVPADRGSALVRGVGDLAGWLDLGVFDLENGVVRFSGERADLKDALFNRGLAALVWLLAGRVLGRVLAGRP